MYAPSVRWLLALAPLIAVVSIACASTASAPTPPPAQTLPAIDLRVVQGPRSEQVTVQVASTEPQRETGLMWVRSMPEDAGMLFVFPAQTSTGFWMKNTYIPLDIAYISADGEILSVVHGVPLDTTVLDAPGPYRYALEMNAGWFARNGFGKGATVSFPKKLPPAT